MPRLRRWGLSVRGGACSTTSTEWKLAFNLSRAARERLIAGLNLAKKATARLVLPRDCSKTSCQARLPTLNVESFRSDLIEGFRGRWRTELGNELAQKAMKGFCAVVEGLMENGIIAFAGLMGREKFERLVSKYDHLMAQYGSNTPLHTYLDLREHREVLLDREFEHAFFQPLLVAAIAYVMGGAVSVTDARLKDAGPLEACAADNMLHIDNTPFAREFKILVAWEKGRVSGSVGQNFVFIPGTNKGVRRYYSSTNQQPSLTENACVFTDDAGIDQMLSFQKQVLGTPRPVVVEVSGGQHPVTTVFDAGSLAHHRYRTVGGKSRSCIIVTFHRADITKLPILSNSSTTNIQEFPQAICCGIMGTRTFVDTLLDNAVVIGWKLVDLSSTDDAARLVDLDKLRLSPRRMREWRSAATSSPEIESMKRPYQKLLSRKKCTRSSLERALSREMMLYDKHGPLDLRLYADNREERRKWARNAIREMKVSEMAARLAKWKGELAEPSSRSILSPSKLMILGRQLEFLAKKSIRSRRLAAGESDLAAAAKYESIDQLLVDLSEAVGRCYSLQNFLSTSLFMFWSCDWLRELDGTSAGPELLRVGRKLLRHYIATSVLCHEDVGDCRLGAKSEQGTRGSL